MKVLVDDGMSIIAGTGIGRYVTGLCTGAKGMLNLDLQLHSVQWIQTIKPKILRRLAYSLYSESALQKHIQSKGFQLVHFANYFVPKHKPQRVRYAVTIHDLTPWTFPEVLPPFYRRYLRWTISQAVERADLIFTGSESVKQELSALFNISPAKLYVTYYGVDPIFSQKKPINLTKFVRAKQLQNSRIILFVGTIEKRKNLHVLVEGFEIVAKKFPDLVLVLVGRPGYGAGELAQRIRLSSVSDRIILWGYAQESELLSLYRSAEIFVFPSMYEGFGIPILEAMAAGLPVIVSNIPAHREVVGEAGLYFDPQRPVEVKFYIERLLTDQTLARNLAELGMQRTVYFTWQRVVQKHWEGYRAILEE